MLPFVPMASMRMSQGFEARWRMERLDELLPQVALQSCLRALVHAPFVREADCLLLEPFVVQTTGAAAPADRTGYEAFINEVHVESFLDDPDVVGPEGLTTLIQQGARAAVELSERLEREGAYRVLLSLDTETPSIILRFFGLREGEPWGLSDPDEYQIEDVLMIDTVPESPSARAKAVRGGRGDDAAASTQRSFRVARAVADERGA